LKRDGKALIELVDGLSSGSVVLVSALNFVVKERIIFSLFLHFHPPLLEPNYPVIIIIVLILNDS
jgi:hypothetical protein